MSRSPPREVPFEFLPGKRQGQVLNMQSPLLLALLASWLEAQQGRAGEGLEGSTKQPGPWAPFAPCGKSESSVIS